MKNWKKAMAMLCTAAMITGVSAPVWAEAEASEETETAAESRMRFPRRPGYPVRAPRK